jgi:flagellar basal-body rod protein FlgG
MAEGGQSGNALAPPGAGQGVSLESVGALAGDLHGRWQAMPAARRRWMGMSALMIAAVVAGLSWYAGRTDWRVLFSGLEAKDTQQIAQELSAAGIAYQMTEDGSGIEVGADQVDKARMEVATKGMPQSGRMGFELFDKPNWVGSEFDEKVNQNMVVPGSAASTSTTSAGLQIGLGTKSTASEVIMTQGDFNQTGNTLDLAIQGTGFFQVQLPNGTIGYTRDGNFSMNNAGTVTDANGNQLLPALTIPANATSVTISQYGVVTATLPGQTVSSQLGTVQLATFPNPGGLNSLGGNLLQPTSSSGNAITDVPGGSSGMGTLQQGYLENSNVDVVAEFVNMILAQRAYESNSKVVHVADDMYSQINGMVR